MAGVLSPDPVLLCLSSLPRSFAIAPLAAVSPSLPNRFFLRCPGSFPLSLPPSLAPSFFCAHLCSCPQCEPLCCHTGLISKLVTKNGLGVCFNTVTLCVNMYFVNVCPDFEEDCGAVKFCLNAELQMNAVLNITQYWDSTKDDAISE